MADENPPDGAGAQNAEVKSPREEEENEEVIAEDLPAVGEDYGVWKGNAGEYGEGGILFFPFGEAEEAMEYPPVWEGAEGESEESLESVASSMGEMEETEEERAARLERERLIEILRGKLLERFSLRRRNQFLNKKLVDNFKKRRMEHVLKEDPKGAEMESKYLKRLFAFDQFKESQSSEINDLSQRLNEFRCETDDLQELLEETLSKFLQRQKEVSLGLVSTKTGKKLSEKLVDRLLRRLEQKCAEKGQLKLKYIKLKNLIEEKEKELKALENFSEGLHIMEYEQLKIDNQNYNDKIEEKEEELVKLRKKTQGNIQNLAQVREKASAIEGDIEILETKFNKVEMEFTYTREKVNQMKKRRDFLREEHTRMKMQSGILSNDMLLMDYEKSVNEKERIQDVLEEMKMLLRMKNNQHSEMEVELDKKSRIRKKYKRPDKLKV